jgi:hypothetical protein
MAAGVSCGLGDNAITPRLLPTGSAGFNRQNGTLVVNVFTPIGVGAAANFTIAERIKDLFDRAKFSSIIFDPASGPAQVTPAAPEPYLSNSTDCNVRGVCRLTTANYRSQNGHNCPVRYVRRPLLQTCWYNWIIPRVRRYYLALMSLRSQAVPQPEGW